MSSIPFRSAVVALLGVTVLVVGCARRPQLSQAQAPSPTGAAVTPAVPSAPVAPLPRVAERAAPVSPMRPAPQAFNETAALKDIHFDFDKSDIRADARPILAANADWLISNPKAQILIEGHCDERGTNEYNLALGDRRAKSTMNYLVARGVAANRITTISYGEERPLCTEHSEACWARNRRAHFLAKAE